MVFLSTIALCYTTKAGSTAPSWDNTYSSFQCCCFSEHLRPSMGVIKTLPNVNTIRLIPTRLAGIPIHKNSLTLVASTCFNEYGIAMGLLLLTCSSRPLTRHRSSTTSLLLSPLWKRTVFDNHYKPWRWCSFGAQLLPVERHPESRKSTDILNFSLNIAVL